MRSTSKALIHALVVAGCAALPAIAGAQTSWISPFVGTTTGGDAAKSSLVVGASGGRMITTWLGVEGEAADAPEFFEQNGFLVSRRVTTVMGTAVVPLWIKGGNRFMPYAAGGVGLLRPHYAEAGELASVKTNRLAANFGGGVMALTDRSVGLRVDLRYFRGLDLSEGDAGVPAFDIDFSRVDYWRVTTGLVIRF
jgi:hypothetical protein